MVVPPDTASCGDPTRRKTMQEDPSVTTNIWAMSEDGHRDMWDSQSPPTALPSDGFYSIFAFGVWGQTSPAWTHEVSVPGRLAVQVHSSPALLGGPLTTQPQGSLLQSLPSQGIARRTHPGLQMSGPRVGAPCAFGTYILTLGVPTRDRSSMESWSPGWS